MSADKLVYTQFPKGKFLGYHMLALKQSNLSFKALSKLAHHCMID